MNIFYLLLISFFWGGSFLAIKESLNGYSPFMAAMLRVFIALVLSFLYLKYKKIRLPDKKYIIHAMLNGAIGMGIPWALLFWGEQYVEPAVCAIINATVPIFTAIFSLLLCRSLGEKLTWNKGLGIIIGFTGIAIIFAPSIGAGGSHNISGLIAIVTMAMCYGLSLIWLKFLTKHMSNVVALFLSCIGAMLVLLPIVIIDGSLRYFVIRGSLLIPTIAILYLGIFSTAVAFIIFYKLIDRVGSVEASAVTYLVPVVSILLDLFILGKWVGNQALLGALIVLAALKLINRPGITSRAYTQV